MGVEYVKEGNACERCKVPSGVNNQKLEHFKKYDIDELLCRDCREKVEREFVKECPKCKKAISGSDLRIGNYHGEDFKECSDCYNKRVDVRVTKLQRKHFIKTNWFKGVMLISVIIGLMFTALTYMESRVQP